MQNQSWTEKHKPKDFSGFLSQKKALDETLEWIREWKPGKSKALLLYGAPGIGKTLLVELLANERQLHLIASNASDERNASDIETLFSGAKTHSLFHKGKIILLDEVDGISGNDRGAVTSIIKLVKESSFPVILIANDPWKNKLKSLRNYCKLIKFSKVHSASIEKRLKEICKDEGIDFQGDVLKNLARWSNGDLRSAINDLQTICKGKKSIDLNSFESLGFRERGTGIFDIMPAIFNSKNIKATRKIIFECDQDPDDIFWWIAENASTVFKTPEELSHAFDIISKADIFRSRVMKQQNWRFKAFMVDMLSSVSLAKTSESHGYTPFKPPKRFAGFSSSRLRSAEFKDFCAQMSELLHCSTRIVRSDYLPFLSQITKTQDFEEIAEKFGIELENRSES